MTPIEYFLIDINQILLRDCIENTIADIGHCEAATDFVQPTLRSLFYKRWPIIFPYGKGSFVLGVAYNIYNVGRLGFFVLAQPKLWFGRHWHAFIFLARKTLANLGIKTWFTDTDRKTLAYVSKERWPIDVYNLGRLEHLDILRDSFRQSSKKLLSFEFAQSFCFQFWESR